MTEQIYVESNRKISQNERIIEKEFNVTIDIKGNILTITADEGKADKEYLALQVIEALELGFKINEALMLRNEDFFFEKIKIKNITRRKNLSQVRGRLIGVQGRVKRTIEDLTDCILAIHTNIVGIIGLHENVEKAAYVIERLIAGSKHANMYAWLEKKKAEESEFA